MMRRDCDAKYETSIGMTMHDLETFTKLIAGSDIRLHEMWAVAYYLKNYCAWKEVGRAVATEFPGEESQMRRGWNSKHGEEKMHDLLLRVAAHSQEFCAFDPRVIRHEQNGVRGVFAHPVVAAVDTVPVTTGGKTARNVEEAPNGKLRRYSNHY